ncbi:hypothetical protein KC929_02820 [Patescibacteria group bacterium]|nr:hypothetical protein [Patescibacteria group bacterium]
MESLSEQEKNTTIENTNEEKETTDITQLETELSSLFEKRDNLKKEIDELRSQYSFSQRDKYIFIFSNSRDIDSKNKTTQELQDHAELLGVKFESKFKEVLKKEGILIYEEMENLEDQIQDLEQKIKPLREQDKMLSFENEKKDLLEKYNVSLGEFQRIHQKLEKARITSNKIVEDAISPGIDMSMSREMAINQYARHLYQDIRTIDEVDRIMPEIEDIILNLEIEISDLEKKEYQGAMNSTLRFSDALRRQITDEYLTKTLDTLVRKIDQT